MLHGTRGKEGSFGGSTGMALSSCCSLGALRRRLSPTLPLSLSPSRDLAITPFFCPRPPLWPRVSELSAATTLSGRGSSRWCYEMDRRARSHVLYGPTDVQNRSAGPPSRWLAERSVSGVSRGWPFRVGVVRSPQGALYSASEGVKAELEGLSEVPAEGRNFRCRAQPDGDRHCPDPA